MLLSSNIFTESIVISSEQWIRCLTQFKYFYRVISDLHCTILLSSFLLSFKNPFRFCKPFTKYVSLIYTDNHVLFTIFDFVYTSPTWTESPRNFCWICICLNLIPSKVFLPSSNFLSRITPLSPETANFENASGTDVMANN